ncbi:MAG: RDD family protein [Longimicrobiales bacterium]|nr:RDD family protein [Longimicrobiales bacterium]
MATNIRDPRSIITPDAFRIDPALLGTPLARPGRRLAALLIDLVLIGLLSAFARGLGILVWGALGAGLLWAAFRPRVPVSGPVPTALLRGALGCLGAAILTTVALVALVSTAARNPDVIAALEEAGVQVDASLDAPDARAEEGSSDTPPARDAPDGGGFAALLRDIWEETGSAVGIWSLYFTAVVTLSNGYTPGKRALGIRVVRLDGEPFTWWTAFERAGGYAAGFATGLLGFAQVFWDPNRQCVHDRIVGTAVVVAGAGPLPGAVEAAWSESPPPST